MANRKHGTQSKTHFGENHHVFIESSEVMEWVKYENVQTKKAPNLLKGYTIVRQRIVFFVLGSIVRYYWMTNCED